MTNQPQGLSPTDLDLIKKTLSQFLKNKEQYIVSFFGSRSRGQYRQYSDLDLWIESTPALSREEEADIRIQFEESNLAIKIDIVTPQSCHSDYKGKILSEKKKWFSRP